MDDPPVSAVFTLRDLNRQPAKVLDAARKFGSVEIRTRRGESFTIMVKTEGTEAGQEFPDFQARWRNLRKQGLVPPPQAESERINRIIAGENQMRPLAGSIPAVCPSCAERSRCC